jgi:arylsulfatase A-like enzyme
VDTLRADLVGAVAGLPVASSPTPHLDALAAEGEVFVPHYAAASWTKPSHAALLTGYPSPVHGALTAEAVLAPAVPTLAERLRAAGLATGGLVHDCVWLNPKFGFHRGFDDYRSVKWRSGQLGRAAVSWMAAHRDRPFFFFLHTFDAHSDFLHLPYEGAGVNTASVRRRFAVQKYGCRQGLCASALLEALPLGDVQPLPREPEILRYLYAAGVRETDLHLGRLFADLRRLGLWDDLTVVITSDHGEMLLEHGRTLHGQWYEQVLKVPLIVKWPHGERAGTRTAIPTSALDVVPTLLAQAGLEADELPGTDLRRPRRDRTLFAHHGVWRVAIRSGLKGVFTWEDEAHLFDLTADPAELHDLASRRPEVLDGLEGDLDKLARWSTATRARLGAEDNVFQDLSGEERERLRALGYLR